MRFFSRSVLITCLALAASPLAAARMDGQEVAALFSTGKFEFVAGSIWTTKPGGRYLFTHGKGPHEEGTYKIRPNGNVTIFDEISGKTRRFYFDKDKSGVPALIYTNGSNKGRRYPIKK